MSLTVTFHNMDAPRRSLADLQLFLIYCHLTAHASRSTSQSAYAEMIDYLDNYTGGTGTKMPFEIIKMIVKKGDLNDFIKSIGAGRPSHRKRFFESLVATDIDLKTIDRGELATAVKGIGLAKASMFVMFRGKGSENVMIIDRNVQSWLRREFNALGMTEEAKSIPQKAIRNWKSYKAVEKTFLNFAARQGVNPRQLYKKISIEMDGETKYDRADAKRIDKGGKANESHWNSRISRNEISLNI